MEVKESELKNYNKFIEINSHDFYSKGVIDFMIRWADLMEKEKKPLTPDVIEKCERKADTDGITGFMYAAAKRGLIEYWDDPTVEVLKEVD